MRKTHIAVLGAGFTGLVCALRLLQAGYRVTILEAANEVGGLTRSFDFGTFRWDRFYHCILTSDSALLGVIDELGLSSQLRWTPTEVGLYSHGALFRMSNALDLVRFPHLSILAKCRLVIATWYACQLQNGAALERISLGVWTQRLFGETVYREIWEPLFRCKLGEMRRDASAAFLWGTLRRLASTRSKGPKTQERLGYVAGGYGMVFNRLTEHVRELGGDIRPGVSVLSLKAASASGSDQPNGVSVCTREGLLECDGVLSTLPARALMPLLEDVGDKYRSQLAAVQYLGMICVVLLLKRQLSPFYVTNITAQVPFTGVIEMTNLIDRSAETAGLHLVYLPRYCSPNDPLFDSSDQAVWELFEVPLKRMYPDFVATDLAEFFVFRERTVQPVPTMNYSAIAPDARSPISGVYIANTAQIINNTLNNNVMTMLANTACEALMLDMPAFVNASSC